MTDPAARRAGRVVAVVLSLLGLGIASWAWPDGITDHVAAPLGTEELFWAVVAVLVALLTGTMAVRAWRDF
jgi:hypothetical protein